MENSDSDTSKSKSVKIDDSEDKIKVASALYIPRISVKFVDFKHFFEELVSGNANYVRIAIKIEGVYYVFNSIQNLETHSEVAKYLNLNQYIPVRGFKFKIEFNEGSIYFGGTTKVIGNTEWQKNKVNAIITFFLNHYSQEYGKTISQQISQLYITIVLFSLFSLVFTIIYLWISFNPNVFSHFLYNFFLSPSFFFIGFVIYLILLVIFILIAPLYLTGKILKRLQPVYSEELSRAMRNNKNYYGISFGAILTLLLVLALIIASLVTVNYPLIELPQNSSNPLPKFAYDLEKFFIANYSFMIAAVLGRFSLAISLPLFIDWYKRHNDIWGESEELFE